MTKLNSLPQPISSIREQHLESEHPDTARSLNSLAVLYAKQGKYDQAEPPCYSVLPYYPRATLGT